MKERDALIALCAVEGLTGKAILKLLAECGEAAALWEEPEAARELVSERQAQALLQAELADMMGSDAHRMNHRRPKLTKGADYIREHCRPEYAEDVLWRNAEKLLLN